MVQFPPREGRSKSSTTKSGSGVGLGDGFDPLPQPTSKRTQKKSKYLLQQRTQAPQLRQIILSASLKKATVRLNLIHMGSDRRGFFEQCRHSLYVRSSNQCSRSFYTG